MSQNIKTGFAIALVIMLVVLVVIVKIPDEKICVAGFQMILVLLALNVQKGLKRSTFLWIASFGMIPAATPQEILFPTTVLYISLGLLFAVFIPAIFEKKR